MVQDLVHNLCESLVENIDGVTGVGKKTPPTPITYLTQWKIVGNSQVHTDPYLTQWKVSGNSVVDNNTILSCGDLEQDGKYHVKISNGVNVYDIALNEPLRKVNDVADTIEFANGVATVTRNILFYLLEDSKWTKHGIENRYYANINSLQSVIPVSNVSVPLILCNKYTTVCYNDRLKNDKQITAIRSNADYVSIIDSDITSGSDIQGEILLQLATPTTELVDVSPFPVSPTDTYTSANVIPYSAFEHTENKEIWSCGEYNATDGKYHILVQPQGGSIADIALNEPLRKVNDVADTIEFPSDTEGKALVIRNLGGDKLKNFTWNATNTANNDSLIRWDTKSLKNVISASSVILTIEYTKGNTWNRFDKTYSYDSNDFFIYDKDYNTEDSYNDFIAHINNYDIIYKLATPTTELVDAPQIEEADSYSCVISQGAKAVEWSSFETN